MSGTGNTVKTVKPTSSSLVNGVLSGRAWGDSTITYAFPTESSSYSYDQEPDNNFDAVSQAQVDAALFTMEQSYGSAANDGFSVEGFTNLGLSWGSDSSATIRLAQSDEADPAWAYLPSTASWGGDVWFGTEYTGTENDYRNPEAGNYAWHTLMHEIGHALGLKHGHEKETYAGRTYLPLPSKYDSIEYSIMTYRGYIGAKGYAYEQYGAPQTFMMADIAALQEMYGADFETNSDDTVYSWTPDSGDTLVNGEIAINPGDNRIFATVWDGGGNDTYDLSAYETALKIDLRPGAGSTFSIDQLSWLGGGRNNGFAAGNIFNALLYHGDKRSLIENAKGGSAGDVITGNLAANSLWGFAGNDTLNGDSGHDSLFGGEGKDRLNGGSGNDILEGEDGNDVLYGGTGADSLTGGSGTDVFLFKSVKDSMVIARARDTIVDFNASEGDKIHLSSIDAQTGVKGNQAFTFIGTKGFHGKKGELRYKKTDSDTYIFGDINGDKKADFMIHLDDVISLSKGYFVL